MPYHFIHIGKTGGHAVKAALRPFRKTHGLKLHRHPVKLVDIPVEEPVFFTIRHPVSRFVSAFNGRLRGGAPAFDHPPKPREARQFARFPTPNDLGEALARKGKKNRRAARRAVKAIGHIKMGLSQYVTMSEIERHNVIWVGDQETLEADFDRLKKILQLPAEAALPASDHHANRAPSRSATTLSKKARRNLEAFLREDLALYNEIRARFFPRAPAENAGTRPPERPDAEAVQASG